MVERKRSRGEKKFNFFLATLETEAESFRDRAKRAKAEAPSSLSAMQMKRSTVLHESIDVDGTGMISPAEAQQVPQLMNDLIN